MGTRGKSGHACFSALFVAQQFNFFSRLYKHNMFTLRNIRNSIRDWHIKLMWRSKRVGSIQHRTAFYIQHQKVTAKSDHQGGTDTQTFVKLAYTYYLPSPPWFQTFVSHLFLGCFFLQRERKETECTAMKLITLPHVRPVGSKHQKADNCIQLALYPHTTHATDTRSRALICSAEERLIIKESF